MPISAAFEKKLRDSLPGVLQRYDTPFHLYDEAGIRNTARSMRNAFAGQAYRQYFAVKALPNPAVLRLLHEEGQGFDCSSIAELVLAASVDPAAEIFFTSNNTSRAELGYAIAARAIVNLDDEAHVDQLPAVPEVVSFRVNPGQGARDCNMIGRLKEAKFGIPPERLAAAYGKARQRGARRFGLHAMLSSNELDKDVALANVQRLLAIAGALARDTGITLEFVNIGGGFGIPYRPEDRPFDIDAFACEAGALMRATFGAHGPEVALMTECGRYVTGPHGILVTRVINRLAKWKDYLGVDASMSALMRPGLYGAYHHITVPGAVRDGVAMFDVVGSLCENMDKFAVDRWLPEPEIGDLLLVHDTGAHGHAMGFTYNGRLRPKELMLCEDGRVLEIRREEEVLRDYLATLDDEHRARAAETMRELDRRLRAIEGVVPEPRSANAPLRLGAVEAGQ